MTDDGACTPPTPLARLHASLNISQPRPLSLCQLREALRERREREKGEGEREGRKEERSGTEGGCLFGACVVCEGCEYNDPVGKVSVRW